MKYKVSGVRVRTVEDEELVAGSVGLYRASFELDETWSEYTTINAVFRNGYIEREQILEGGECEIPWEVLDKPGSLCVGIYGKTAEKVRPTLWAIPKSIREGAEPSEAATEPTPDKWQQLLSKFDTLAAGVTPHIGENGNWWVGDNDTGVKASGDDGDDYVLTEADKTEIVADVLASIPDLDEEAF